ncbi:hypothetical protein [Desulfobotulus alkaliphilus]|nr:hypothetical protein [Desulfobotulus alkaliphilus]
MVREYTRHMGVPIAYAGSLAVHMQQLAEKMGLPDREDPAGLKQWQEELLKKLSLPFSITAKNAIEEDEQGYYIQLFLDLLDNNKPQNPVQQAMLQGVQEINKGYRQACIPSIIFLDETLGIHIPCSNNSLWRIEVDGEILFEGEVTESPFLPVHKVLPQKIKVSDGVNSMEFDVWEDSKNNRMLLFGERDMRLLNRVHFGTDIDTLPPGSYTLLSRFEPDLTDTGSTLISDTPSIYASEIHLGPGEKVRIVHGSASLLMQANAMPHMEFRGAWYRDYAGLDFLASRDLGLHIRIPDEFSDQKLRVRLRSRDLGEPIEVPLHMDNEENISMELESLLEKWKAGMSMVSVECLPENGNRPLIKTAARIWNGLEKIENNAILCRRKPENLLENQSENFHLTRKESLWSFGIHKFEEPSWQLTFQDGANKISATWRKPGIHMVLRSFESGSCRTKELCAGESIPLINVYNQDVVIQGLDAGKILLGNTSWTIRQNQHTWCASLSSLHDVITDTSPTLIHESRDSGMAKDLLTFVTPHHCSNFHVSDSEKDVSMAFLAMVSPDRILMEAINLLMGNTAKIGTQVSAEFEEILTFENGGNCRIAIKEKSCRLSILPEGWEDGLWRFTPSMQCNGRFGRICNPRQDEYSSFAYIKKGSIADPATIKDEYSSLPPSEKIAFFRRIHDMTLRCHSQESWDTIRSWLPDLWKSMVHDIHHSAVSGDRMCREKLIETLADRPPEDASSGWVPLLQMLDEKPDLMAWPAKEYPCLCSKESSLLFCLVHMKKLENLSEAIQSPVFHSSFWIAGRNPSFSAQTIKTYLQTWENMDLEEERKKRFKSSWMPEEGELLGPLHYRWAMNQFLQKHHQAISGTGNNRRRSWASLLCKKANNTNPFFYSLKMNKGDVEKISSYGLDGRISDTAEAELASGVSCYLSSIAYFCRNQAHGGSPADQAIKGFLSKLEQSAAMKAGEAGVGNRYLAGTGQELLGFYLLFWEWGFQAGLSPKNLDTL